MPAIDYKHIWRDSWDNVYSIINSNLADPKGRNKKWIFSAFPDINNQDFAGWPIVIINPPNIGRTSITLSSVPLRNYSLDLRIEIFHDSAQGLKDLADSVLELLENNRENLRSFGMQNFFCGSSNYDILRMGRWNKIHYVSLPFSWTHKVR